MTEKPDKCLCAFCKLERRVYHKRHISPTNILLSVLVSLMVMLGAWQAIDARVLVVMVFCLAIGEMFVQLRWRLTLACPFCGFDPALYLKSPRLAAERVRVKLEHAKENTALLSVHNPWTHLRPLQQKARRNKPTSNRAGAMPSPAESPQSSQI